MAQEGTIPAITERLLETCAGLNPAVSIGTADLVRAALPHDVADQRLAFTILNRPPAAFDGYWTRGVPVRGKFGVKRPYLWHGLRAICPHCHGSGRVIIAGPAQPVLQTPVIDTAAIPAPAKAMTWADFDLLDDAAKNLITWPECGRIPRDTATDIESYLAEMVRRTGKPLEEDSPEVWSVE